MFQLFLASLGPLLQEQLHLLPLLLHVLQVEPILLEEMPPLIIHLLLRKGGVWKAAQYVLGVPVGKKTKDKARGGGRESVRSVSGLELYIS